MTTRGAKSLTETQLTRSQVLTSTAVLLAGDETQTYSEGRLSHSDINPGRKYK